LVIGKVIKKVTSTVKNEEYSGYKLLLVQPAPRGKEARGKSFLAIDLVQAGENDFVLVVREGGASRMLLNSKNAPVHSVIVGIIDHISLEE
jgi:carbon dioxide concentrating mechanism protein CcmL